MSNRNYQIIIKVNKEELEKIKEKAREVGLTVSSYVRFNLMHQYTRPVTFIK